MALRAAPRTATSRSWSGCDARSRWRSAVPGCYDAVSAVAQSERYRIAAIITDGAYAEYDVDVDDFARPTSGRGFLSTRMISESMISELVDEKGIKIAISANWRFVIPSEVLRLIPSGILNLHVGRLPDYKEMRRRTGPSSPASRDLRRRALHGRRARRRERPRPQALPLTESTYIGDVVDWVRAQAPDLFGPPSIPRSPPGRFVARGSTGGLRCYRGSTGRQHRLDPVGCSGLPAGAGIESSLSRGVQLASWPAGHGVASIGGGLRRSFLAVPGQVLTFDRTSGTVDVACGSGVLRIEEIEVDGRSIAPAG